MENEEESNYVVSDQTVRGLQTRAQAESILELTERSLKKAGRIEDYILRVEEKPSGSFDMLVLKRVN